MPTTLIFMSKKLVIGYGNPLCGDDGVAWHVVEALQGVLPVDSAAAVHQLTPEWAETISMADLVIFIDAAVGPISGEIQSFLLSPSPGSRNSHEISAEGVLAMAVDLFGRCPPAHMVTIAGGSFDLSERLTPPVAAAVPGAVAVILGLIGTENETLAPSHSIESRFGGELLRGEDTRLTL